jgi:4-diphosphocytidyl-2-C-methyl-D-erythritol kinase
MANVSGNCDLRHAFLRTVNPVTAYSPAKVNLSLAITGRRADGYHDLVSVAAPLDFGDELSAEGGARRAGSRFSLECDQPGVPLDGSNLILKAAEAFAAATGWTGGAHFALTKRIPLGAGLGGGSSNAVAALRVLNKLAGGLLNEQALAEVAVSLGSDCAIFLTQEPVVIRGRGERVTALPPAAGLRLRGRRVLLIKPGFAISTPWAYGRMVARGTDYVPANQAEARLAEWLDGPAPAEGLLANNMEAAAFEKFLALPLLLERLRTEFAMEFRMSGSGSACFALLREDQVTTPLITRIRECWGPAAFIQEARIA